MPERLEVVSASEPITTPPWRACYNEERPHSAIGNKAPITLTKSGDTTSLSP